MMIKELIDSMIFKSQKSISTDKNQVLTFSEKWKITQSFLHVCSYLSLGQNIVQTQDCKHELFDPCPLDKIQLKYGDMGVKGEWK